MCIQERISKLTLNNDLFTAGRHTQMKKYLLPITLFACAPPYSGIDTTHEDTGVDTIAPQEIENVIEFEYEYLMTFHSCDAVQNDCGNPMAHEVHLAGSHNGYDWSLVPEVPSFNSSVPDIIIRDEILYIFALPSLMRLDLRSGLWLETIQPQVLDQTGAPVLHVDPSLFIDEDNNIVLFFMEGQEGFNPATCPLGDPNCIKYFFSATEVSDSQGSQFIVDEGIRMEIQLSESQKIAADPDIFEGPDGYYQYVSRGQNIQVFFSTELRGAYLPLDTLDEGILTRGGGGVPAGHYDSEQELYFTFVTRNSGEGQTDIRLAMHDSLDTPLEREGFEIVISGETFFSEAHVVASPGFLALDPRQ